MDSVETSGKSVDDAVLQALARLGRRRDEVEVMVLQEPSRGVRGVGAKDARVRVWLKRVSSGAVLTPDLADQWIGGIEEPAAPPAANVPLKPRSTPISRAVQSLAQRQPAPPPIVEDEDQYADEDDDEEYEDDEEFEDEEAEPETAVTGPLALHEGSDLDDEDQDTAEGAAPDRVVRQASDILRAVLHHMELPVSVEVSGRDPLTLNIRVGNNSDILGLLIGRRGETLSALQLLVNLMLNHKAKERYHILVDAESYRNKRDDNLRSLALRVAKQVQESQRSMTLEPMTPYERRIVHMTLQESPYVQTQSTGEGEQRRVVVSLKPRQTR